MKGGGEESIDADLGGVPYGDIGGLATNREDDLVGVWYGYGEERE